MRHRSRQLQSFALRQMQFQLPLSAFSVLGSRCAGCRVSMSGLDPRSMLLCLYLLR
ncbi:hypothetical protein NUH88_02325 [Nisaea acidiphila]|uniref:Uncharacterized protein n=1 Tax=Nisaea acidiphila TaxID=1862145 RepID=A0A9J7AT79_9PROT|nr:hypothetical protein [Nisaea acidiphila]UUX50536.1 hypothetical protein NUH88_02325 [Nisaea acidiphila]